MVHTYIKNCELLNPFRGGLRLQLLLPQKPQTEKSLLLSLSSTPGHFVFWVAQADPSPGAALAVKPWSRTASSQPSLFCGHLRIKETIHFV